METVIRDVELDVEADVDLPPLTCDSSAAPESCPSTLKSKRTFSDILRGVKVREDTLQCAVARLGGGTQGLQVLMEHVNYWALKPQDGEDVTATIRRGIVDLGMPPAPNRLCNLGIVTNCDDGNGGDLRFNAKGSPRGACESVNHGATYTRALRKSYVLRQRGQTRVPQPHHSMRSKYGNQSRQWRLSTSYDHWSQVAVKSEFSNENGKGFEFLFQKELRASDVSSLGRIVLPKKDAERHFPFLVFREGITISLEDYDCGKFWTARYRFWLNNKSRMYLLENIGDFVNFHHLRVGDLLLCYQNEQGGLVIRGQKVPLTVETPGKGPSSSGAQAKENLPTTEMKTVTTVMPAKRQVQFVEGESTFGAQSANLANSSFDSLKYTFGEIGDGKYFQDGYGPCFSQHTGYPICGGDVCTGFPASCKPLVHDCGFDSVVDTLSISNVKELYIDENLFLQ